MKKIILIAAIAITAISFKPLNEHLARPQTIDGFQVFIMCQPVDDFEKIGYIKTGVTWSGHPSQIINNILKQAKKKYPTGDAIIIDNDEMDQALVIKFK